MRWFADIDTDTPDGWFQPVMVLEEPVIYAGLEVWFETRAECEAFMRDDMGVTPT